MVTKVRSQAWFSVGKFMWCRTTRQESTRRCCPGRGLAVGRAALLEGSGRVAHVVADDEGGGEVPVATLVGAGMAGGSRA